MRFCILSLEITIGMSFGVQLIWTFKPPNFSNARSLARVSGNTAPVFVVSWLAIRISGLDKLDLFAGLLDASQALQKRVCKVEQNVDKTACEIILIKMLTYISGCEFFTMKNTDLPFIIKTHHIHATTASQLSNISRKSQ